MKNTLVLVTDFGGFKAFRLENDQPHSSPRLELLEEYKHDEAHHKMVERVSDLSGRFPRRTGARAGGAMSDGERHNIALENRKRGVRNLAGRIDSLMQNPEIVSRAISTTAGSSNPLRRGRLRLIGVNLSRWRPNRAPVSAFPCHLPRGP